MAGRRRRTDEERLRGERLGAAIAAARQARGHTQEDVARDAGVALSTFRKIETGQTSDPSFFTVLAIAEAVQERLDDLAEAVVRRVHQDSRRDSPSPDE